MDCSPQLLGQMIRMYVLFASRELVVWLLKVSCLLTWIFSPELYAPVMRFFYLSGFHFGSIPFACRRFETWLYVAIYCEIFDYYVVWVTHVRQKIPKFWYIYLWFLCYLLSGCAHELCVRCALYLCSTSNIPLESSTPPGSIPCPLCRHAILYFVKIPGSSSKDIKLPLPLGLCTPCMLHPREREQDTTSEAAGSPDTRKNRVASVSSDMFCPVTCSLFPSVTIPLCTCNEGPCPEFDSREREPPEESPPPHHHPQPEPREREKLEGVRPERTTCSNMFWGRRSCSRENQCNAEINAWMLWIGKYCGFWFWDWDCRP